MGILKKKNNIIYVPIGIDCTIASYLRFIGYRKSSFPFDWIIIPIESSIKLINNKFHNYLELENLHYLKPTKRLLFKEDQNTLEVLNEVIVPVYDKKYHALFVHDFTDTSYKEFSSIKEKYNRRINKLLSYIENDKKIILLYNIKTLNSWQIKQYENSGYIYTQEDENYINAIPINDKNISILSFNEFKKNTRIRYLIFKIRNKLFKL